MSAKPIGLLKRIAPWGASLTGLWAGLSAHLLLLRGQALEAA